MDNSVSLWKLANLSDVCLMITDGAHQSPKSVPHGLPMASVKDLTSYGVNISSCRRISMGDYNKLLKQGSKPIVGDVLISKDGATALDTVCVVTHEEEFVLLSSVAILRPDKELVLPQFLRYFLDSETTREYMKRAFISGAAIPRVVLKDFKRAKIFLPPLPTQRKIASILSAYDDLIENNLRRIKVLEEMAQNLYREWFVKFRFPGYEKVKFVDSPLGKIPEGWEVKNILDISDVTYGFPFKSKLFNEERIGKPVARIRDILSGESKTFSEENGKTKHIVNNGDILVGMDGDFHMGFWVGGVAWLVQRVALFTPRKSISRMHLFQALKQPISFFNKTITGTTVAHLGHKHIQTVSVIVPDTNTLEMATCMFDDTLDHILNLRLQNHNLRQTRDLLLPKLISGKLDVSDLDIQVPEDTA